jgi:outer membrane lipoprotein carrier protein
MNVMHKQGVLGFVLRCLPRGVVVLAVCALGAGVACASSLDTLESFLKTTQSGRADFTQVVTPPTKAGQAVRGKTSTGTFAFMRPSRFRFDYQKPFPMTIVADGQTLWLYDADLAQVTARKQAQTLGSTPAALVATAADLGALQKDFTLTAEPDAENLHWVQATPKARDSALQSVRIGLRLDGGFAALAKLDILDALGQRSVLSFERFEVNPGHLSQAAFSFVPPKGVDVVRP